MQNIRSPGLRKCANEIDMPDISRCLLPAAIFQIGNDVVHEQCPIFGSDKFGTQGHGIGALGTAAVAELARCRVLEVTPEIC